jgi:hypothetical protein
LIVIIVGHHLSIDIDASGLVGMLLSSSNSVTDNVNERSKMALSVCPFLGGGGVGWGVGVGREIFMFETKKAGAWNSTFTSSGQRRIMG